MMCLTNHSNLFKLHCNNIIIIVPLVCSLVALNQYNRYQNKATKTSRVEAKRLDRKKKTRCKRRADGKKTNTDRCKTKASNALLYINH